MNAVNHDEGMDSPSLTGINSDSIFSRRSFSVLRRRFSSRISAVARTTPFNKKSRSCAQVPVPGFMLTLDEQANNVDVTKRKF